MSEKVYIEIDASPWMDAEGITSSVFVGDACEPTYEKIFTYKELVDKELGAHTVKGKLIDDSWGFDHIDSAEKFVIALEEAAKYARATWIDLQKVEE